MEPTFGIAEVLDTLWGDLEEAERAIGSGRRQNQMSISGASVEIAFTVTSETSGSGGLSIRVLGFGAEGKLASKDVSEQFHRVTIHLEPLDEERHLTVPGQRSPSLMTPPRKVAPRKAAKRAAPRKATGRKTGKRAAPRKTGKRAAKRSGR